MRKISPFKTEPASVSVAAALALGGVLAMTACTEVRGSLDSASSKIDGWLGVDTPAGANQPAKTAAAPAPLPAGEAAYREGLALREAGRPAAANEKFAEAEARAHPAATYELARAFAEGEGVPRDEARASQLYRLAAERGDARALYLTGLALYEGRGVPQDQERGVRLIARAAAEGHAPAQYALGQAFANGQGVARNRAWAARWYGKAAYGGYVEARYAYGVALAAGHGLPRKPVEGYAWLSLAAEASHAKAAELRDSLAATLDPADKARAGTLANRWRAARAHDPLGDAPTVLYVQQALQNEGYDPGPLDGYFGGRTAAAIRKYEAARGMAPRGVITAALVEDLFNQAPPEN